MVSMRRSREVTEYLALQGLTRHRSFSVLHLSCSAWSRSGQRPDPRIEPVSWRLPGSTSAQMTCRSSASQASWAGVKLSKSTRESRSRRPTYGRNPTTQPRSASRFTARSPGQGPAGKVKTAKTSPSCGRRQATTSTVSTVSAPPLGSLKHSPRSGPPPEAPLTTRWYESTARGSWPGCLSWSLLGRRRRRRCGNGSLGVPSSTRQQTPTGPAQGPAPRSPAPLSPGQPRQARRPPCGSGPLPGQRQRGRPPPGSPG